MTKIYYSLDRDENGLKTIFHLTKGDVSLYNDEADILFAQFVQMDIRLERKKD